MATIKSIEEKAKAYDEAFEKLRSLHDNYDTVSTLIDIKEELENIFPELKESEDERIRKALLEMVHDTTGDSLWVDYNVHKEDAIAWLEKQGEQKPADKVEPKFQNGQWIVWQGKYYKVNDNGCGYELVDQNGLNTSLEYGTVDESAHVWDITKDAKDGDVLACDSKHGQEIGIVKKYIGKYGGCDSCFETYCFVDWDDIFRVGEYMGSRNIHPTTKEQRDLLFKKMKEAGYEFDFEKKELKKISQRMISAEAKEAMYDKPAWSKEDEKNLEKTIWFTEEGGKLIFAKTDKLVSWLKSLKDRYAWKPSKKEKEALLWCVVHLGGADKQTLGELLEALNKL